MNWLWVSLLLIHPTVSFSEICKTDFESELGPEQTLRERVQSAVYGLIQTQPPLYDQWSADRGCCIALSHQLYLALKKLGFPVRRYVSEYFMQHRVDAYVVKGTVFHFYLSVPDQSGDPSRELIIDPTYLQIFKPVKPVGLPAVFVGTRAELAQLYRKYSKLLSDHLLTGDPWGQDASRLSTNFYGFGPHSRRQEDYASLD